MADEVLAEGHKDAIHVPYAVVTSEHLLYPGDKVCFRHGDRAVRFSRDSLGEAEDAMWHGVVDPFLENAVEPGTPFRLMVRKECFSGLTHTFTIDTNDRGGTGTCHNSCDVF